MENSKKSSSGNSPKSAASVSRAGDSGKKDRVPARQKKKPGLALWLAAAAVLLAAVGLVLLLTQGKGGTAETSDTAPAAQSTEAETVPSEAESISSEAEPETTLPRSLDWSGWVDALPDGVTDKTCQIEARTLYRTRSLETATSTSDSVMDGWELYDTVSGGGEYGPWSDWSPNPVAASDSREVMTQTRYRYSDKETTTDSSPSLSGWTQYDSQEALGDFGPWSDWSTGEAAPSDNRDVQTKTQYRYRDRTTSGGVSEWGVWSGWSDTAPSSSQTRQVETRTVFRSRERTVVRTYFFYRWTEWSAWSSTEVSASDTRRVETAVFYRYRDRAEQITYCFRRWSDWSDYTESPAEPSDTLQVETKTVYRFRSK